MIRLPRDERQKRDKEILMLAASGLKPLEISRIVNVSSGTVGTVCRKAGFWSNGPRRKYRQRSRENVSELRQWANSSMRGETDTSQFIVEVAKEVVEEVVPDHRRLGVAPTLPEPKDDNSPVIAAAEKPVARNHMMGNGMMAGWTCPGCGRGCSPMMAYCTHGEM